MNAIEWNECYSFIEDAVIESMKACPQEYLQEYKDMDLETYWNNLVEDCWYGECDDLHCDGINVISFYSLIEDDNDKEELKKMFDQAREEAYNRYFEDND